MRNAVAVDEEGEDLQFDVAAVEEEGTLISVSPRHLPGVLGQKPVFAADTGPANEVNGVIVAGRAVEKAQVARGLGDLGGRDVEVRDVLCRQLSGTFNSVKVLKGADSNEVSMR